MEAVEELGLTLLQLEQINACRMFLQIMTLAEMTKHMGTKLLPQIMQTKWAQLGLDIISQSTLTWPHIHNPLKTTWNAWTQTICNLFTGLTTRTQLRQPLGAWTSDYQWYQFWKWHLAMSDWLLFQHDQQTTPKVAILVWSQHQHLTFLLPIPTNQLFAGSPVMPHDVYQCTIDLPVLEHLASSNLQTEYQSHASLVAQFFTMLVPWQCPLFGPQLLLHWKECATISLVSEASVQKNKQSGFAWVLNHDDHMLWNGAGLAPGPTEDIYSGRVEAFGMLTGLLFVW